LSLIVDDTWSIQRILGQGLLQLIALLIIIQSFVKFYTLLKIE